jgi:dienelactone hydrolase
LRGGGRVAYTGGMRTENVSYEVDGRTMVGHYAVDEYRRGPRPAVLLCHEGVGLEDHVRGRAVRLASLGYAAFALDYFGGGEMPPREDAMALLGGFMGDAARTRAVAKAGFDQLLSRPEVDASRVAAIGYCFGGVMAIELARTGADLKAVVAFHAGQPAADLDATRAIRASLLLCSGAEDPFFTAEQRRGFEDELRASGVADWRVELYGGVGHSFTNTRVDELGMPGLAYDAKADRRSWRSMLDLFAETMGSSE